MSPTVTFDEFQGHPDYKDAVTYWLQYATKALRLAVKIETIREGRVPMLLVRGGA